MSTLGIIGHHHGNLLDGLIVHLGILPCHIRRSTYEIENGAVQVFQRFRTGVRHLHLAHTSVQDEIGLQTWVGSIGQHLGATARVSGSSNLRLIYLVVVRRFWCGGLFANPVKSLRHHR